MSTRVTRAYVDRHLATLNRLVCSTMGWNSDATPLNVQSEGSGRYSLNTATRSIPGMSYLTRRDLYFAMGHMMEGVELIARLQRQAQKGGFDILSP